MGTPKFKLGERATVKNYPNHFSYRWSGEVIKIEESPICGFDITIKDNGNSEEHTFHETALK